MVNMLLACGKSVNTLFIRLGITCVHLPTVASQPAIYARLGVKNQFFSTNFSASYQRLIHRTRYLLDLLKKPGFTQYPHHLLLLKRKLKKEIS